MTAVQRSESRQSLDPTVAKFLDSLDSMEPELNETVSLETARARMHDVEGPGAVLPPAEVEECEIPGTIAGPVRLRIIRPMSARGWLPGVVYLHGGGWVSGDAETHEWVARSLAVAARSAVVFVEYHRSPEARFPVALEESYDALSWLAEHGGSVGVLGDHLAVAGDSAGGNMATVACILAKQRGGPSIACQVLFYPTTDVSHAFPSFEAFGRGYYLTADALLQSRARYLPARVPWDEITVSPLRASIESLRGLPPALIITAEFDPLRDEGEAYARHLMNAGVRVTAARYLGTIHAFLTLKALAASPASTAAIAQAGDALNEAFHAIHAA